MDWLKNLDYQVFHAINNDLHSTYLDPVFLGLSYTGLGQFLVVVYALLLISPKTRFVVIPLLMTLLLSGGIIADAIFKQIDPRDRPSNLADAFVAEPHRFSSFPSGHSCDAFGAAFTILLLLWHTPGRSYGWVLLIWAFMVGVSRIYRGVHWPTDVLAGALVGLFSATVVVSIYNLVYRRLHRDDPKPVVLPS